jgi:hypothetical protein
VTTRAIADPAAAESPLGTPDGESSATTTILDSAPMLHAGAPLLTRSGGRIQVGCDPDRAVIVEPPGWVDAAALHDLLHSMRVPRSTTEVTSAAIDIGLTAEAFTALLDQLVAADLASAPAPSQRRVARKFRVRLHGGGPIAAALAESLQAAHFAVETSRRRPNTGWRGVGMWQGGLVVLTDALVPDPALVATLMRHRTPHLVVRMRDDVGIVGPMVLPGLSSCLACADRYRHELDADWPLIAAQLVGRVGSGTAATLAATVAFAHAQIEHVRDAWRRGGPPATPPDARSTGATPRPPASVDQTIELRMASPEVRRRPWPPHPLCDCHS